MIVFDLETTGLDDSQDDIIEVGFVIYEDMTKQKEGGCLVKTDQEIPDEVVRLTGITNDDLESRGFPWPAVRKRLRPYFEGEDVWCAHNASFDIGFLNAHFDQPPEPEYIVDTMRVAERFVPSRELDSNKLEDLTQHFGISMQNAHRAVEDASATGQLLKSMMDEIGLDLEDLLGNNTIKLGPYHTGEDPMEALYSGLSDR